MSKELFFIGEPVEFKPGIKIYPPSVKDVLTNKHYSMLGRILTYSQEEIEDEFLEAKKTLEKYPSPIEFLLNNCFHNKDYEKACREAFRLFVHEEITFIYEQKMILIGKLEEVVKKANSPDDLVVIREQDFFDF